MAKVLIAVKVEPILKAELEKSAAARAVSLAELLRRILSDHIVAEARAKLDIAPI